jgi:predicted DNA-binding transcriptional regulator AlpA
MSKTPKHLSEEETAKILGMSRQTLANWRWQGKGPPYRKIGSRVRYPMDALIKWLRSWPYGPHLIWLIGLLATE